VNAEELVSAFLIFLATIDPIGTLALFVGLTADASAAERRRIAFRCIGISAATLLAFVVVGQLLLGALGVRLVAFQLAGGIIFFLFGLQMVFGSGAGAPPVSREPDHDIAVFPLAVPSIASPGSILAAVVLTDNSVHSIPEQAVTAALLLGVLGLTLAILLAANPIHRFIGRAGANLLVRVLGLVLASLAVEMVIEALFEIIGELGRTA